MDNQKKISLVEALLMVLLNLFADVVDVAFTFLALVPVVGAVMFIIAPIISLSVFAITEFWLIMRGGMGFRQQVSVIVGNVLDIIPLLGALPFKTVSVITAVYMVNHPKVFEKVAGAMAGVTGEKMEGYSDQKGGYKQRGVDF